MNVYFEIAALFHSAIRRGKKGGNFKINIHPSSIHSFIVFALELFAVQNSTSHFLFIKICIDLTPFLILKPINATLKLLSYF